MNTRSLISIILFVLAVALVLVFGLAQNDWLTGVLLGLACAIVGFFFYRRARRGIAA